MVAISCRLKTLRTMSSPWASEAYLNDRSSSRGNWNRKIAVSFFSGLVSSACARASAAAIAPIRSLDWCIGPLHLHGVKGDRARLGAFGAQAVAFGFLCTFGY